MCKNISRGDDRGKIRASIFNKHWNRSHPLGDESHPAETKTKIKWMAVTGKNGERWRVIHLRLTRR
jgi:hypothetical protein